MRIDYGYRRFDVPPRSDTRPIDKNCVHPLNNEDGLRLHSNYDRPRTLAIGCCRRCFPKRPTQASSMNLVANQFFHGPLFRVPTIVEVQSRGALESFVDHRIRAERVVAAGNRLAATPGTPARTFADNASEFFGRAVALWTNPRGVEIHCNPPGKSTDNCVIDTINASLRDEHLNLHRCEAIDDTNAKIAACGVQYKASRPRQARDDLTPLDFSGKSRHLRLSEVVGGATH